ncbi:MAG: hypothetical protein Q7T80_04530 [Methanoregula sp.]|nr:hypothetical protein [Methanoregula sp.]
MYKRGNFFIVTFLLILIISGAGCIESHVQKTETVLTKMDRSLQVQWTKVYENSNYSSARSATISNRIIQTSDNGYLIAGHFSGKAHGDFVRFIKTDSLGKPVWDNSIIVNTGDLEFLTIMERSNNGYTMISRHGHVYLFNVSGSMEGIQEISRQINKDAALTHGTEYPPVTLYSVTRAQYNSLDIIVENHADIYKPLAIVRLAENGTIVGKTIPDQALISSTTNLIPTHDGGFLFGNTNDVSLPEISKISVVKIDINATPEWNSTFASCIYLSCENVLLGMHESENRGYEIIYLSTEVNKSGPDHGRQTFMITQINSQGNVTVEKISDGGVIPGWLWDQGVLPSELISMITGDHVNSTFTSFYNRYQESRVNSLIKTRDGGFAIVETRYVL